MFCICVFIYNRYYIHYDISFVCVLLCELVFFCHMTFFVCCDYTILFIFFLCRIPCQMIRIITHFVFFDTAFAIRKSFEMIRIEDPLFGTPGFLFKSKSKSLYICTVVLFVSYHVERQFTHQKLQITRSSESN